MKKIHLLGCILALSLVSLPARAEEADPCFSPGDLGEGLTGICLKELPEEGTLLLGRRILRPGDVLTAGQAESVTFHSRAGGPGEITYLPISREGVLPVASFRIPGRKNAAPVAQDSALETYQNLPVKARLRVEDPEQKEVTVTVTREPRRGTLGLEPGGKITYTPKKNKVGMDSFSYTATDPEGNVSREAEVTVTILKPSDRAMYRDTANMDCSFSAEWMKNTGIFTAENVGDACCFQPQKLVSRGEFLTMLLKTLDIAPEKTVSLTMEELPLWLQPYAAAAVRWGLTAGIPEKPNWEEPVSGAEAAVMIQNALDLPVPAFSETEEIPAWAASSAAALREQGIYLGAGKGLTRGETAELLYGVHLCRTGR